MENRRNFYRVLHVQQDAPVEIIKTSYRTMMQRMKMHPDLGGDHWTATVINEAYSTLIDEDKRAAYDQTLSAPADEFAAKAERQATEQAERAAQAKAAAAAEEAAQHIDKRCPFCGEAHHIITLERDSTCGKCNSPLLPAEFQRHDDGTRRAVARMPKAFRIRFVSEWPTSKLGHGEALDLSVNGLRFSCNEFVPTGTMISIDSDVCSAIAEVRSSAPANPGTAAEFEVGVRFVTLRFHRTQGGFVSVTA